MNGGKNVSLTDRRQHGAEYTQSSYLGMLKLEQKYMVGNYYDPRQNKTLTQALKNLVYNDDLMRK